MPAVIGAGLSRSGYERSNSVQLSFINIIKQSGTLAADISATGRGTAVRARTDGTAYPAGTTTITLRASGTASGATTSGPYPISTTTVVLGATGTGTILAGDFITFAGNSGVYTITSSGGTSDVNGGTITFTPGLNAALASAVAVSTATTGTIFGTPTGDVLQFEGTAEATAAGSTYENFYYRCVSFVDGLGVNNGNVKNGGTLTISPGLHRALPASLRLVTIISRIDAAQRNAGAMLDSDENGYLKTMSGKAGSAASEKTFTGYDFIFCNHMGKRDANVDSYTGPFYQPIAGGSQSYIFRYDDGPGASVSFSSDATGTSSGLTANGRILKTVTPSAIGLRLKVNAVASAAALAADPNAYIKNFRFYANTDDETAGEAGEYYNPDFMALVNELQILRFMNPVEAIDSSVREWADYTQVADRSWASAFPHAAIVALINKCNNEGKLTHAHINVNVLASDDYIEQMANYYYDNLNPEVKIYLEFSNENWNTLVKTSSINNLIASEGSKTHTTTDAAIFTGTISGGILTATGVTGYPPPTPTAGYVPGIQVTPPGNRNGLLITDGIGGVIPDGTYIDTFIAGTGTSGGAGQYVIKNNTTLVSTISTGTVPMTQYHMIYSTRNYCYMRTVQTHNIWRSVWGASNPRLMCCFGGWFAQGTAPFGYNYIYMSKVATSDGGRTFSANCTISGTTLTINSGLSGTVGVHQLIEGAGVEPATYIQSGSGSTWTVNKSHSPDVTADMTGKYWSSGDVGSNCDTLTIGAYFGQLAVSWPAQTVDQFFDNHVFPIDLPQAKGWFLDNINLIRNNSWTHLGLTTYEAGNSYGQGLNAATQTLFQNVVRNSRMGDAYRDIISYYLTFPEFEAYVDTGLVSMHPSFFSARETIYESDPPKWAAILSFIARQTKSIEIHGPTYRNA